MIFFSVCRLSISQEKAAEALDKIGKQIMESEKETVEAMKKLNEKYIEESQAIQIKLAQGYEKVAILLIYL